MYSEMTIYLTLIGMSVVTMIPRILPILLLSTRTLPDAVMQWLEYIPVAVLAALLAPSLFLTNGKLNLNLSNIYLWAAIPCFWVAWKTRNLLGTVAIGLIVVVAARLLGF